MDPRSHNLWPSDVLFMFFFGQILGLFGFLLGELVIRVLT